MQPITQYAKSGDVHIAYQNFGSGPINVVMVPGFVSNVENYWEQPDFARFLRRLSSYARVVTFDKRGTGGSDRVSELPGLDIRMDDLRAVMDAAGMEQAALLGISEGAPLSVLFAATYPERCRALALYGSFSRFSYWFPSDEALANFFGYVEKAWGSGGSIQRFAPSRANDIGFQQWWGRNERLGASPSAVTALMRMNSQIDISGILPAVRVPTLVLHRTDDQVVDVAGGRDVAAHIPGAKLIEFPGIDHIFYVGEGAEAISDAIEEFLTGAPARIEADRVLATVLFTDIVGSTEKAANLGDLRWRNLLDDHHTTIRRVLARFRGREVKTTGDGFLATFDGPARGVRCACAIVDEIKLLGIEVRAGLHTGECEVIGDDVGGIAVHIGARVAALAGRSEVLVSSTVKDLVAGSGLRFDDRGAQSLKGIPGEWRIFATER
ncbi:adenylate/guanylate cyclase domain-containing protein [Bradyrhizobium canariense]|uniref:Adenylate/guanylate cyclase domain-containing protein n=1 Tax=Bradyrhizobium canariense TaxID=255045 RepID=A0A1X3G6Q4_9BRAD|nr:adenylate/guanylate cyclase domain-containing protein [Bradyrhizobium canariense]OSI78925.1 adenylate/guanylate cyclase domain-containing protein [Bradyrhizobium canariense]OSI82293.1 adenylate/guanylate cyclase domain-containing protein [Bradyrhizobium canariense]OSI96532.1 adenylate/guanylate cyclase domain-containing protein [Bradyrhizobium canariense]OSI97839.1 adenylate/guanylate cyclase domain-containing protein [Bradyrhizobium canariense]OSJ15398.1 adenylate/guanylate cyclase domain-